jgi:putative transposase
MPKDLQGADLPVRGKSLTCRKSTSNSNTVFQVMQYRISVDSPSLFITAVGKDRLPVFRTDPLKQITCQAIEEARNSCAFLLFAYVIMPDHVHLLTDAPRKPSEVLQYIKGIVAHRLIDYLKLQNYESSLHKLKHADWKRNHRFSLWKVNYIHMNPVRAGLVEKAQDYRWSSARWWNGTPAEDEPLRVDLDRIGWRRSGPMRSET